MRELDELLLGWLERHYPHGTEHEKAAFRRLLALPDARLIDYLLHGDAVDERELSDIVRRVRSGAGSG